MPLFISIIIPCRNEEKYIGKCLDSIIKSDFPSKSLEILVVDGCSTDKTREVIKEFASKYPNIKLLDNPQKITPVALNIGIKNSRGDVIVRMDAHNIYEKDYISKCVKYLEEYKVDNVGGIWVMLPGKDTFLAKSIALAVSHLFGVGNAYYKIGLKEPKYVDTVPFGCYRRDVFDRIGFFDEELIRNQDDEFNLRLIKAGGKILLVPDIVSYCYARDSLRKLWKMYFQYGYFKPLVVKKTKGVFTWRQLIPMAFVGSLIISGICSFFFKLCGISFWAIIIFYSIVNVIICFSLCIKNGIKHFIGLFLSFTTLHFAYGVGYLKGIWDFMILKKSKQKTIKDIPLTR
ncbi:MAG: glycosyltransferase family 2 protein [bacterium]|nr:glycosyltransferase family 2 protein [bacterium]